MTRIKMCGLRRAEDIDAVNELLPEYKFKISAISLEDFIKITLRTCPKEDKSPFLYFKERYIPKI